MEPLVFLNVYARKRKRNMRQSNVAPSFVFVALAFLTKKGAILEKREKKGAKERKSATRRPSLSHPLLLLFRRGISYTFSLDEKAKSLSFFVCCFLLLEKTMGWLCPARQNVSKASEYSISLSRMIFVSSSPRGRAPPRRKRSEHLELKDRRKKSKEKEKKKHRR